MRDYNLGKRRGKAFILKECISLPGVPTQEDFRKKRPHQHWLYSLLLASCVALQGRSVSQRLPSWGEPGPGTWVGIERDELLTSQRSPRGSILPSGAVCQEAATRHREHLSLPFSSPGVTPCKLVMCEKRHRENHKGTRYCLFKKEKFQITIWHCAVGQQNGFTHPPNAKTRTVLGKLRGFVTLDKNDLGRLKTKPLLKFQGQMTWWDSLQVVMVIIFPLWIIVFLWGQYPPHSYLSMTLHQGFSTLAHLMLEIIVGCCSVRDRMFGGISGPLFTRCQ